MAKGDTKTNQYLDIAANGTRADLPTDTCCETRSQTLIREVAERIITEEETRYREDQILQNEIDEIKNNPDVADIVPTYAALQDYDTSKLTDQDIIRVLADETHEGASTYYRWSTSSQAFTYVGETGDYYTKNQVNDLLDSKQDELTAGDNVTIEDESGALVISATDTTYSNFTGTDGTSAGTAGLVPAPATTDAGKFLKADGTWDDAAGSTYTAGDGINITNDVISATNTGKARVLTTADYNYPANDPTSVALWLLSPGVYTTNGNVTLRRDTSATMEGITNTVIIGEAVNNYFPVIAMKPNRFSTGFKVQYLVANASGSSSTSTNILTSDDVYAGLSSTSNTSALAASQGKVLKDLIDGLAISGAGAPTTSTVGTVGQLYQDTTNGKLYICTDATNPYVWEEVGAGGGGGPTVVQAPGTSTTDVMSQNATTSMIFADPATQYKIKIGAGTSTSEGNDGIEIGHNAAATKVNSTAVGTGASATGNRATAIGQASNVQSDSSLAVGGAWVRTSSPYAIAIGYAADVRTNAQGAIAIGDNALATMKGQFDISTLADGASSTRGYNNSPYRLLTGLYDPQSAHDAATKGYVDGTTETYTIATSDWSALSASSPYDYQATVTATYTIGANTIAELLNDDAVSFATYGFAIGSISSQSVTIYSIGQPSASVSLKINYKG